MEIDWHRIFFSDQPYVVRNGKLCMEEIDSKMGLDEFFGGLREQNIEHLGQLRCVILEDTGELSVFYYRDEEVKPRAG